MEVTQDYAARKARPFLKWVGGKGQLLEQLRPLRPTSFTRYYEPFVGGGAMFFDLEPKSAVLSDANLELIDCYRAIQCRIQEVIDEIRKIPINEETYYKVRAMKPADLPLAARAARMIYLNKTDFNGLYRVNKSGGFNVPWGKWKPGKLPTTCDEENLRACSVALAGAVLMHDDFESAVKDAPPGSWIYFDSPYLPVSKTAYFTSYTVDGFGLADMERLAQLCSRLAKRGVNVMLSSPDIPKIRELFDGFHIHAVQARRNVNCNAAKRGKVGEVVVTSYGTGETT